MSQLNPSKNNSDPLKIYYDIQITNLQSATTPPPTLYFNEIRNTPFIQCPQDYYFSIIRFTLDTPTLPVFIPEIATSIAQNPTQNINQTIYSFQFEYAGIYDPSGQYYILWSPQDLSAYKPTGFETAGGTGGSSNRSVQISSTGYYNCYTYEWWVELINQQLIVAFNQYKDYYVAYQEIHDELPVFPATAVPPQMAWDSSSGCARLVFTTDYVSTNTTPINFYVNSNFYNLFSSFNAVKLGYNDTGRNWKIQVVKQADFNTYELATISYVDVIQEWSTTSAMSPISSLVFVSNTLPIVSNQLSSPLLFNEGNVLSNYGNNSNFQQVITDIVADDGLYKPNLVYNPTAQYRLVDMMGNYPLTSLDVSVFWKNKVGTLNPFYLGSGACATLKILFTKKGSDGSK